VVAHPRGNSLPVTSDDNDDNDDDDDGDDDDVRPFKKCPSSARWRLLLFLSLLPVQFINIFSFFLGVSVLRRLDFFGRLDTYFSSEIYAVCLT